MGDYNINYLDRYERNNLDSVIIPYGLNVCSSETPTRITQSSETHIDYIIAEDTSKNIVFESNFKSDHLSSLLITQTKITKKKPRKFVTFDKKNYDPTKYTETLRHLPWHHIYSSVDVITKLQWLILLITHALELHAPLKSSFIRNQKPKNILQAEWFNSECRQKHKEKQKNFETHQTEKTEESWKKYIESKNP